MMPMQIYRKGTQSTELLFKNALFQRKLNEELRQEVGSRSVGNGATKLIIFRISLD